MKLRLKRALLSGIAIGAYVGGLLPNAALASSTSYALPDHYTLDKLGVDIGSLQYERHDTFLTIGDPAEGGLAWTYIGHSGSDPYAGTITSTISPATPVAEMQVKIGGALTIFAGCQNGACDNASGTGATLVQSGSYWLYTADDGSIYKFDPPGDFSGSSPVSASGKLLSITRPSGAIITINYPSGSSAIKSVVSSRGYALIYGPPGVSVVNLANHTCDATVSTCDGVDASVAISYINVVSSVTGQTHSVEQITDPAGQNWQYEIFDIPAKADPLNGGDWSHRDGLWFFRAPTGYEVSLSYDNAGRITSLVDNRGNWTYSYPDETLILAEKSWNHTINVTDPSGKLYYTAHAGTSISGGWTTYVADALNNQTLFGAKGGNYDGYIHYQRLGTLTKPEGNVRTWTYDWEEAGNGNRGNIIQVTDTPKPSSSLTATSITAVYPSACTHPASCNKPTSETDAKGNTTNYTYSATHGGLLTEMDPAPADGLARPLKLVTWVQKTPYYYNPSGVLTASATPIWVKSTETVCQTVAGSNSTVCDSAAPKVVTTYEYGADGTANALWPHGIKVVSGGVVLRTCYSYDALGNKISETKPKANLTACP